MSTKQLNTNVSHYNTLQWSENTVINDMYNMLHVPV